MEILHWLDKLQWIGFGFAIGIQFALGFIRLSKGDKLGTIILALLSIPTSIVFLSAS